MIFSSLVPEVTATQAQILLTKGLRETRLGRLRLVTEFFVPFRLYRVLIRNGRREAVQFLAADLAGAGLDLLRFETPDPRTSERETAAVAAVQGEDVRSELEERLRRQVMAKGFFRIRNLAIELEPLAEFCVPYHIGVYERSQRVRLEVLNAVTGRLEGARVRELVTAWFQSGRQG